MDALDYDLLPVPRPVITHTSFSGTQLVLNGTNGMASGTYFELSSSNLTASLYQWTRIATNFLNSSGVFALTVPNVLNPSDRNRFFALQVQ